MPVHIQQQCRQMCWEELAQRQTGRGDYRLYIKYSGQCYKGCTAKTYGDYSISYTYDHAGNVIAETETGVGIETLYLTNENSGYGYEKFAYNGFNQMTKYENEKNNIAEYDYLSNGLRLSKTVNRSKTSYIWDGDQMIMTITADETRSYAKAPGYMRTETSKELTGGVPRNDELYLFNGHGDVVGITDKSGNLEKSYEYDAFGNEINPNSNDNNPFRYCGEYRGNETGSIYLRARYYSPGTGRFTTEDPIRGGSNWYSYCGGNPVAFWDPSGLKTIYPEKTPEKSPEEIDDIYSIRFMAENIAQELGCGVDITVNNEKQKVDIVIGTGVCDKKVHFILMELLK